MKIVVAGAGGFIGGGLASQLAEAGHEVRAVDIKPLDEWWQASDLLAKVHPCIDLSLLDDCITFTSDADEVYNLAAQMGGMNFIEHHKLDCMLNVLINTHMLVAAERNAVSRFFFSGSACCYTASKQTDPNVTALTEADAYPAEPEDGYGWEKLFSERMCEHFNDETTMAVRTARFHNVYGPLTSYDNERGKAPASISRKVAEAVVEGRDWIEVWGDGKQTRTFMWIEDCLTGIDRIMHLDDDEYPGPMNLGSAELVSIDELVTIAESIAGVSLERRYDLTAPQGVRGRSSDNALCREVLDGWEPSTPLADGMAKLYPWVLAQVEARG